jgi:hypothetical protein
LDNIDSANWKQYIINLNGENCDIVGSCNFAELREVVIVLDDGLANDRAGVLYVDDECFIDTDSPVFVNANGTFDDSRTDAFIDTVERRTFQYFLENYNETTGLVYDRARDDNNATIAGTGFGLAAMMIGAERGWVTKEFARDYALKVCNTLLNVDQIDYETAEGITPSQETYIDNFGIEHTKTTYAMDTNGYKGFYFHHPVSHPSRK